MLLGKEYRIGHAPLMEKKLREVTTRFGWEAAKDKELRAIAHVFRTQVLPTLMEYFHDWRKAMAVAGTARFEDKNYELFVNIQPEQTLIDRLPDEYELSEARSYDLGGWWDPHDEGNWNPERFEAFMKGLALGT